MLLSIGTVTLAVDDHAAAVDWYTQWFDVAPYFERPGYSEFRVGATEQEVGFSDAAYVPGTIAGTAQTIYWSVEDVEDGLAQLLAAGATLAEPVVERGPGFRTAAVTDPFGHKLGIMENSHAAEVLTRIAPPSA